MARNISENFGRIYVKELIVDQDGKIEIIGSNNVTITNESASLGGLVLPETLSGSITGTIAQFNQLTAAYILNENLNTSNINTNYITGNYIASIGVSASDYIIANYITGNFISGNGANIWGIQASNIEGLENNVKSQFIEGFGIDIIDLGIGNKSRIEIQSDKRYITINSTAVTLGDSINVGLIRTVTGTNGVSSSVDINQNATLSIDKTYVATLADVQSITGIKTFSSIITASSGITSSNLETTNLSASDLLVTNVVKFGTFANTSSFVNISGSISYNILSTTLTNIILDNTHNIINSIAELTCTLPSASLNPGKSYIFKRNVPYNMLITCSNSDIIENFNSSLTLDHSSHNQSLTLISDGNNNWIVLNYSAFTASSDINNINRLALLGE